MSKNTYHLFAFAVLDPAYFIVYITGLEAKLAKLRLEEKGKKIVCICDRKKEILEELDIYSVNKAALFPEHSFIALPYGAPSSASPFTL